MSPFISLPQSYNELYSTYTRMRCEQCGRLPVQPAVCLLCGTLVCAGSDCCRARGDEETTRHAAKCGGGIGAFVIVRTTATLLLVGRKHTFWGSLYLDSHGEEDYGITRGRPLLLAQNRLLELTQLWKENAIRELLHKHPPPFPHLILLPTGTLAGRH